MKIFFAETGHIQHKSETLDYSALSAIGQLELADIRNAENLVAQNLQAEILIIGRLPLSRQALSQFSNLRLVVKAGTGVEKIDLVAAREMGITVVNLSGYAAQPVGQATMAFILAFAASLPQYHQDVRERRWREIQFTHSMLLLPGKCLGIIGLGGISRRVIELAKSFDMRVQLCTRYPDTNLDVEYVDIGAIATKSDFISIHCALDSHTRSLVNSEFLARVKKSVYLINTARPAVIDEQAVVEALHENRIAGLAMDGFWREPPEPEHELFAMPNVIITPHITWAPLETRQWMIHEMASIIRDFFDGSPRNVVN
jgi:glycerate dehydrogenase